MKDKDLNFEKALADLEAVVEKLEKGGLSLNDSLAQFEKGVKLARFLREELDKAEKKVEIFLRTTRAGPGRNRSVGRRGGRGRRGPMARRRGRDAEDEAASAPKSKAQTREGRQEKGRRHDLAVLTGARQD